MPDYKKALAATQWQQVEEKEMNLKNIQEVVLTGLSDCPMWKMRSYEASKKRIKFLT